MQKGTATPIAESDTALLWRSPLPRSYVNFIGRKLLRFINTLQGMGAFVLITLGVLLRKFGAVQRFASGVEPGSPSRPRPES